MSMTAYVGRRLVLVIPQMLLISVVTFTLIRMLPGDPARLQVGPLASEEGVQALREGELARLLRRAQRRRRIVRDQLLAAQMAVEGA